MDIPLEISNNEAQQRLEGRVRGALCRLDYRIEDGVMHLIHTQVPSFAEGRGIGGQLVKAAMDHAEAHGLRVHPVCSFVATWIRRHPEYDRLRA